MANSDSFSLLVGEFTNQVRHIKALFAYTSEDKQAQWNKDLAKLDTSLSDMEARLRSIGNKADAEKEHLPKIQEIINRQRRQSAWLDHMDENRPALLPGNDKINVVDAPPKAAPKRPVEETVVAGKAPGLHESNSVNQVPSQIPPPKKAKKANVEVPIMDLVTAQEFEAVPGYIKGRIGLDKVNQGVEELNTIINKKYSLLSMNSVKMNDTQLKLYNQYIETDGPDTKGLYYIQERELKTASIVQLSGTNKNIIQVLRSTNRVKEFKAKGVRCYAINPSNSH